MDSANVPDIRQRDTVRGIREQVQDAVDIQQRVFVAAGRVNEEAVYLIFVIDIAGPQMARRIPSRAREVVAYPESGVAGIARRFALVPDIGEVDLEVVCRGAAAQRSDDLMGVLRIGSYRRDKLDRISCARRKAVQQPDRPHRMTPRAAPP